MSELETNNIYTKLDYLQKRYDYAKESFDKLLNDINILWEDVIYSYLNNDLYLDNGFLQNLKNNKVKGQQIFYNFMFNNSIPAKLVLKEYKKSLLELTNYLKNNPSKNVKDTNYYSNKMNDNLEFIKESHLKMLKKVYGDKWNYSKENMMNEIYDNFFYYF